MRPISGGGFSAVTMNDASMGGTWDADAGVSRFSSPSGSYTAGNEQAVRSGDWAMASAFRYGHAPTAGCVRYVRKEVAEIWGDWVPIVELAGLVQLFVVQPAVWSNYHPGGVGNVIADFRIVAGGRELIRGAVGSGIAVGGAGATYAVSLYVGTLPTLRDVSIDMRAGAGVSPAQTEMGGIIDLRGVLL